MAKADLVNGFQLSAVNYYHKVLYLGCCSSPRSDSRWGRNTSALYSGTKNMFKYFVKIFKINRYRKIILFLPVIPPTIWCFEFCYTKCFCEFQGFHFYYDTIYRYILASFSEKPVVYCLIYHFVVPTTRIFSWGVHSLFSKEAVNLFLLLTHVETVFRRTPYFVATSLFDNPFSRFFKAMHFSAKDLFVRFHFTGAIFTKKTSDEKLKTFFLPKNRIKRSTLELSNFGQNVKTKVRENKSRSSKGPTILSDLPRYSRYRVFCLKKCVMFKGLKNLFDLSKSSRNWVFEFSRVNCSRWWAHGRFVC